MLFFFFCFRLFNCTWGALLCSLLGSINRISNLLAVLKYQADVNLGFGIKRDLAA